jgi:vitamin B12 transporter
LQKIILFSILFSLGLFATPSHAQVLDTFTIYGSNFSLENAPTKQVLDTAALQRYTTLAEALQQQTSVMLKSNSALGLSTMSIRGSSASQVNVLWHGFNINMASLAQTDMNIIPIFFIDNLAVQTNSSSNTWASGDIGGSILLQPNIVFSKQNNITIATKYNTNNTAELNMGFKKATAKYYSSTKVVLNNSKNNYPYYDAVKDSILPMPRASFKQYALLQQLGYKVSNNNTVQLHIWLQQTHKLLPPTIFQTNTKQAQTDEHVRAVLEWQQKYKALQLSYKLYGSREYLLFTDSVVNIYSTYTTNTFNAEAEANYTLAHKHKFTYTLAQQNTQMFTQQYTNNAQQHKSILRIAYATVLNNYCLSAAIRQELVDAKLIPTVANVLISKAIKRKHVLSLGANRNYRLPTFNDLFWKGAANPALLPEHSLAADFTYKYQATKLSHIQLNAYYKQVNNWILWSPNASNIWQPQNIAAVNSKGAEVVAKHSMQYKKTIFTINALYAYNHTINTKHKFAELVGKQLIYTPAHKATASFIANTPWVNITATHTYLGLRYTTTDNTVSLPALQYTDIALQKNIKLNTKHSLLINAQVNNVFNIAYTIMPARPMPLRNFGVQVLYNAF